MPLGHRYLLHLSSGNFTSGSAASARGASAAARVLPRDQGEGCKMNRKRLTRWTVLAGAVLALLAPAVQREAAAQGHSAGQADPAAGKIYTNKTSFQLPI